LRYQSRKPKKKDLTLEDSLFEFMKSIIFEGSSEEKKINFIMKFQQLTGPIMAKGLEDTSFYRYFLLTSLNEVGGSPDIFGNTLEDFHNQNQLRSNFWPHTLLGSTTHDTKRSEDVRARINVLSEIPLKWKQAVSNWMIISSKYKTQVEKRLFPELNEEYFIYQTLVGTWPFGFQKSDEDFRKRIIEYVIKASKEGKVNTSWTCQNIQYENALTSFISNMMTDSEFLSSFLPFENTISNLGKLNSLSQTLIKMTSPGVPDFYQGTELWSLSLVDPDNRRPVDYTIRKQYLEDIKRKIEKGNLPSLVSELLNNTDDGKIKLFFIYQLLSYRKNNREIFSKGNYSIVEITGDKQNHIIAYKRNWGRKELILLSSRFYASLDSEDNSYTGSSTWGNTIVKVVDVAPNYTDILTGLTHKFENNQLKISNLFQLLPFCVLVGEK